MITISDNLIRRFEMYLTEAEASPHTISKYLRDVRKCRELIGVNLHGREQLITFKHKLLQRGYAARSINSMLSAVNRFLVFCGRSEWKIRFLKVQRPTFADCRRELNRAEYQALVEAARCQGKDRLDMILQTICSTGIRVSELKAITVESLDNGVAQIHSKGKLRQILLPYTLRRMLWAYCRHRGITTGGVFLTRFGNVPDRGNIWKEMKKLCKQAGVPSQKVFPHNLRHLFARSFYQKHKDIVHLADILGHSSVDTTRIYTMKNSRSEMQRLETLGLFV